MNEAVERSVRQSLGPVQAYIPDSREAVDALRRQQEDAVDALPAYETVDLVEKKARIIRIGRQLLDWKRAVGFVTWIFR